MNLGNGNNLWNFTCDDLQKQSSRGVFSIKLQAQACKKKTLEKVFSCEFCEIYKNTSFTEHIWMSTSGFNH